VNLIQQQIFTALGQAAGLSALVGARIYPDQAPQATAKPYVVWQEISDLEVNDLSGSAETSGVHNYRIQVTFWDVNATKSREGGKQVRLAMSAASAFKSLHIDSRAMPFEPDTKLYGMQSDFSVWLRT
jgi:hypothetical protein